MNEGVLILCAFGFLAAILIAFLCVCVPFAVIVWPMAASFVILGLSLGFGIIIALVVMLMYRRD